jgi:hypothetical protein
MGPTRKTKNDQLLNEIKEDIKALTGKVDSLIVSLSNDDPKPPDK